MVYLMNACLLNEYFFRTIIGLTYFAHIASLKEEGVPLKLRYDLKLEMPVLLQLKNEYK